MDMKFLVLGIPVALFLWSVRSSRLGKAPRIVTVLLALLLFAVVGLLIASPVVLSGDPWFERSPGKQVLILITLLVGMAARSLDQAIEVRSQQVARLRAAGKVNEKPGLSLDPWDFFRPFLVALPTFGTLLGQIGDQPMGWVLIVLAFQTGFFCQTVFKKNSPAIGGD